MKEQETTSSPIKTMHNIGARLAPDLGDRLGPHARYLGEGGIWKKYVMAINLNHRHY